MVNTIKLKPTERNSSIELLRLMMMFLIILHHFCFHGIEEVSSLITGNVSIINILIVQIFHFGGIDANSGNSGLLGSHRRQSMEPQRRGIGTATAVVWYQENRKPSHFKRLSFFSTISLPVLSGCVRVQQ